MRPTLKDIAERAGVSIGTVDRAIHNRGRVSPVTRDRVRAIVRELGYSPNLFASNLSTSRTHTFAAVVPENSDQFVYWGLHQQGLRRAEQELAGLNIHVSLETYRLSSTDSFEQACRRSNESAASGFIVVPPADTEAATRWVSAWAEHSSVVLVDSDLPELDNVYFRGQDPVAAGRVCGRLMNYALERGDKAVIVMPSRRPPHLQSRAVGFREIAGRRCSVVDFPEPSRLPGGSEGDDELLAATLRAHPDTRGIVVPNATVHRIGSALSRRKDTAGIAVIGYDAITENVELLRNGYIDFLIGTHPEVQSYRAVYTLYQLVLLKQTQKYRVLQPIEVLLKENVDSYVDEVGIVESVARRPAAFTPPPGGEDASLHA